MAESILGRPTLEKLLWRKASRLLEIQYNAPDSWPQSLSLEYIAILQYGDGKDTENDRKGLYDEIESALKGGMLIPSGYEFQRTVGRFYAAYGEHGEAEALATEADYEKWPMGTAFPKLTAGAFREWFHEAIEPSEFIRAWWNAWPELMPYETALRMLRDKYGATPEEFAMWVFTGELRAVDRHGKPAPKHALPPESFLVLWEFALQKKA
jgi:hypothetical protein